MNDVYIKKMQNMIKVNLIIVIMSLMISGCATQQGNLYTPEDIVISEYNVVRDYA